VIADTNVLLRILERDAGAHGRASRIRVEKPAPGTRFKVLAATALEVTFVLESGNAGYGWDRGSVAAAVEAITDEPGFMVEHGDALARRRPPIASARSTSTTATWTRLHGSEARASCRSRATWRGWGAATVMAPRQGDAPAWSHTTI
jgi:predicted nucleic-acid-binding protein